MLVLLTTLVLACEPTAASTSVPTHVETLPNGLQVVVSPLTRTDAVALHLHVGVGGRDEAEGQRGVAHLFEHLMFEGSAHAPGNAYDALLNAAGGENNAFTTADETGYVVTIPSGALDLALFLESDRLAHLRPALTAEALANQQEVVIRERRQDFASPHGRDDEALAALVFPEGHPYHTAAIGIEDDVRGTALDAARAFHARHYRPDNAVLGIVGNVDPEVALARVRHWFADVPRPDTPPPDRLPAEGVAPDVLPVRAEPVDAFLPDTVEDVNVYLAWRAVPSGHPDEAALILASFILADGRGTVLDDLRYRRRWVTDADARLKGREVDGWFQVGLASDTASVARITRVLERRVGRIARKGPSDELLQRARRRVRALLLDRMEDPARRAETLVDCLRLSGEADCIPGELERIEAVTAEDVARVLTELLARPRVRLTVLPEARLDELPDGAVPVEIP